MGPTNTTLPSVAIANRAEEAEDSEAQSGPTGTKVGTPPMMGRGGDRVFVDAISTDELAKVSTPGGASIGDSFTMGLDSILATVSAGISNNTVDRLQVIHNDAASPVTTGRSSPTLSASGTEQLSANELDASRKIRKKYGLSIRGGTPLTLSDAEELDMDGGANDEALGDQVMDVLLRTMRMFVKRFMVEGYSAPGAATGLGVVEEEHPLLAPFLGVIEIALWYGIKTTGVGVNGPAPPSMTLFRRGAVLKSPWELILLLQKRKDPIALQSLENVRQFSSLRTPAAKVRAWLRVTLMNKTLSPDLSYLTTRHGGPISYR